MPSVFLTGLSIRNLYPIKRRIGLDVPEFSRLVWLRQTLLDVFYTQKRRVKKLKTKNFKMPRLRKKNCTDSSFKNQDVIVTVN